MKIRLALWGAGNVAKKFARAVEANSDFELVGVASRTFEHANTLAHEYGIKAYDSYDELLNMDNIDFVYISTPTRYHYYDMKKIIEKRKNIICEKPFTETSEEASEILRLADEKNIIIIDGLWSMYMPLFEYIIQKSHEMGRLLFASASLGWPTIAKTDNKISTKYELWDYEIYPVSIMTRLYGNPKTIRSKTKHIGDLISENVSILKFQNGGLGRVHASLSHRSSYIFIGIYSKGIILSRKWWLGDQRVYTWRFFFIPDVKKFNHSVNGYEHEIAETRNRMVNRQETKMYKDQTISILTVLDRIKQTT